ncbi:MULTISPECIES: rhodanese-like domain-containing protein [Pseudomonas]|uniref:Sulfurtransferase n=2 Tax=Pseudomonas TaxID=286 RepID=A0A178LN24_9PSED|nr:MULTISPECIES: rhodanese-like domain-containing protein [Pseudomonas]MCD4866649.1 rhodanese-like domain-containing protein [Pseudomonas sp. PLB05]MDC7831293.1 rhodanese-like domain-containing protein [Pseudomonas benzopyrenica]MXS21315.1 rhodanese-like domain-containing protein [Pseudomonas oryzihabitans]NRH43716.1 rhodanese-like domain-containing protein [Pseudomonas sp. MS15a(2019)]OAN31964.1 sulfurtransferase [Pseudomonas oryzihabitans]
MEFLGRVVEFATHHPLLVAAFLAIVALMLFNETRRGGRSLSTGELTNLVNREEGVVLDIRPSKDFAAGHIVGALNIAQEKVASSLSLLEKHKAKTLIVVDSAGQQAGAVCGELQKAGFTAARLNGGIATWRAENLPLVK